MSKKTAADAAIDDASDKPDGETADTSLLDAVKAEMAGDGAQADEEDDEDADLPLEKQAAPPQDKPADEPAAPGEGEQPAQPAAPDAPAAAKKPEPNADDDKAVKELGLKGRAEERFRDLSTNVRELSTKVAELEPMAKRATQWQETFESTGATPQQVGETLAFLTHANSGTLEGAKTAIGMIEAFRSELAQQYGIELAGVDHLQGFDDLKKLVADGDITEAVARETATLRRGRNATQQREQQTTQTQQWESRVNAGAQAVDTLCGQLRTTDPQFAQKWAMVEPLAKDLAATLPPEKWAGAVQGLYQKIALPKPVDTRRAEAPPAIQRGVAAGGSQEPQTMVDAVRQSIGMG